MKKCKWCNSNIESNIEECPFCKAKQSAYISSSKNTRNYVDEYLTTNDDDTTVCRREINKSSVKCKYCGSTNTKKITNTEKAVNIALFGIFGNRRKYQWHCNNCNSDF